MPSGTVLVVEDDDSIRYSLRLMLQMEGYDVVDACNGQAALDLLKTNLNPCLIFLDLTMPIMDGYEFLRLKNEDVSLASIPVAIYSAIADKSMKIGGVVHVVNKPGSFDDLIALVKNHCLLPPKP